MNFEELWNEEQIRKKIKQQYPNLADDPNYDVLINKEVNKAINKANWSKYSFSFWGLLIGVFIVFLVSQCCKLIN